MLFYVLDTSHTYIYGSHHSAPQPLVSMAHLTKQHCKEFPHKSNSSPLKFSLCRQIGSHKQVLFG